jgi:hypothetical protein
MSSNSNLPDFEAATYKLTALSQQGFEVSIPAFLNLLIIQFINNLIVIKSEKRQAYS